jgi:hypothetical protein
MAWTSRNPFGKTGAVVGVDDDAGRGLSIGVRVGSGVGAAVDRGQYMHNRFVKVNPGFVSSTRETTVLYVAITLDLHLIYFFPSSSNEIVGTR